VDADRIREKIERLEAALLEGKISEETYRELKEKYEAELAEISTAQASGGSDVEGSVRRAIETVNSSHLQSAGASPGRDERGSGDQLRGS